MADSSDALSSRRILFVAAFFALLAGVVEAQVAAFNIVIRHHITWVSHDVAWMSPLAYLLFFLPLAVALLVASRLARRPVSLATATRVFAFCTAFSWLLPFTQISKWASLVLALGIAMQLGRLAGRNPERWYARMRGATVALGAFVIATGAGVRAWRAVAERRAVSGLAAFPPGSPNVLVIVLDTERAANLSLYGYGRRTTPRLDARAREGVVFDRAIAPAPWTLPSHASLFTGKTAGSLGGDWRAPMSDEPRTLAETLRSRGYVTAGFVANRLYTSYESGLARGFSHYDDYPVSLWLIMLHSSIARTKFVSGIYADRSPSGVTKAIRNFDLGPGRMPADVHRPAPSVSKAFLKWQRGAGDRPYFAFLNYFDAHGPYISPRPYSVMFTGGSSKTLDQYDGAIAWLDSDLGDMLDSLESRKALDNTILIVTSDHGEQFGEHQLKDHANSLYLPLLHVPLVIRYPARVPAGQRIGGLVTLRDLAATVLDLAGADSGAMPGRSLTQYWRTPEAVVPSAVVAELSKGINVDTLHHNSRGPMQSILDERLHYIVNGWGREELYAYRQDSLELTNLISDSTVQGDLKRLRQQLDSARGIARGQRP